MYIHIYRTVKSVLSGFVIGDRKGALFVPLHQRFNRLLTGNPPNQLYVDPLAVLCEWESGNFKHIYK